MKNPFKSVWVKPKTEEEEKWEIVGILSAIWLFIFLGTPLFVLADFLKRATVLSPLWFGLIGGILTFLFAVMATSRYWIRLAHNLGYTLYMSDRKNKPSNSDNKSRSEQ
jgi:hypothetical protein